jgi:hypothetical protein
VTTKERIYVIGEKLIEASSLSKAKNFAMKSIPARLASQADLVEKMSNGVKVEKSTVKEGA